MNVGQSDPGGGRADSAHRAVEPVGGRIVRGASVQVVRDATQLLEVEAGHVSLDDAAEEAGGLGTEQHRSGRQVGGLNGAVDRVQRLPVPGDGDAVHRCALAGAEQAGLPVRGVIVGLVLDADVIRHHALCRVSLQRANPPVRVFGVGVGAPARDQRARRIGLGRSVAGRPGHAVALEVSGRRPGGHQDLGGRAASGGGRLLDDLDRGAVGERGVVVVLVGLWF